MTISTHEWADGELRISVIDARVACPRVGTVDLDRCRECAYLLRLEDALAGGSEIHVVCSARAAGPSLENGGEGWWTE